MSTSASLRVVAWSAVLVAVVAALGCGAAPPAPGPYHCPMHPTYVADRPGDCPICGMRLTPIKDGVAPTPSSSPPPPPSSSLWSCPMDPEVRSSSPARCPKCGMALVLQSPADSAAATPLSTAGLALVVTTDEGRRLAGVRTEPARRERIERTVRTVGTVSADEALVRHVHSKTAGWVEKLHVDSTGQAVRQGQPVLDLYSPELLASQEEYLRARATARRFLGSTQAEVRRGGEELVTSARRRLELFDVPAGFVAELERSGKPRRAVTLMAPCSGVVTSKSVFQGQQVEPGMELFTVTDLSRVRIEADVYENESSLVHVGGLATLTLAYDPKVRLSGKVAYVYPYLNPETRTLKARFEFANPGLALKPGMYANVELALEASEGVVVPDSALMDTGARQVVFVDVGGGRFEPRAVRAGLRADGRVQLLEGVREGELVAVAAAFLLDSESRLRGALGSVR